MKIVDIQPIEQLLLDQYDNSTTPEGFTDTFKGGVVYALSLLKGVSTPILVKPETLSQFIQDVNTAVTPQSKAELLNFAADIFNSLLYQRTNTTKLN